MVRCFVLGCPSIHPRDPVRFFRFPHQDSPQFKKWLLATGNQELLKWDKLKIKNWCRICSLHFTPNYMFRNFFTKADMPIPTENLPSMPDPKKKRREETDAMPPPPLVLPSTSTQVESHIPVNIVTNTPSTDTSATAQTVQVQNNNLKRKLILVPNNVKIKSITQANGTIIAKQLILPRTMSSESKEQLMGTQIVGNILVPTVSNFNNNITSYILNSNMKFHPLSMPATSAQIKELPNDQPKGKIVKNTQTVTSGKSPVAFEQREINKLKDHLAASEKSKVKAIAEMVISQKKMKFVERKRKILRYRLRIAQRELKRLENLSPSVREFLDIQLRSVRKKEKKGVLFSDKDKMLALSMFRCNRKCYKILRELFALPSRSSLKQFLDLISISPGINANVLFSLKSKIKSMDEKERTCLLMYDEIPLTPHLDYSLKSDIVLGFEDDGLHRSQEVADVVQVYMMCGIFRKWKIPIAYNFSKSSSDEKRTESFLKEIVTALAEIGFKPIAFLCDNTEANIEVVQNLGKEPNFHSIDIEDTHMISIYNPAALLTDLRNNLVGHNIKFMFNCSKKLAKWSDVERAYHRDCKSNFRVMNRLSLKNITRKPISRKNVSLAVQVFSKSVAACIEKFVRDDALEKNAMGTAYLCGFLDKLFDSLTGNKLVNLRSSQNRIWHQALLVFKSMEFKNALGVKIPQPAVIKHWISTIKGFLAIRELLLMDNNHGTFPLRAFNNGAFNEVYKEMKLLKTKRLTCLQYSTSHKSFILDDLRKGSLENTKELFTDVVNTVHPKYLPPLLPEDFDPLKPLDSITLCNISSFVLNQIDPIFKQCDICESNTFSKSATNRVTVITNCQDFEGELVRLQNCALVLLETLTEITNICNYIIPYILHVRRVSVTLQNYVQHNFTFRFTKCAHSDKLETVILELFLKEVVLDYIKTLNNLLGDNKLILVQPDTLQTRISKF
ncbi:PREDICTED: uncharacterized protein LOC108558774 isoform X2 [Nicrophorus vespilloides]|uniref:Uncharacterized protein LOC108558774 isoform X2 n=1 Tax=Nicrophorus vespilloides TaxID=110193 RepID=A0ABM1M9N7_NICVS|nr:PREDICTED: uncharacterized protein LOC108558774 isoform X2 [Nicrophorus vespilloides]